MGKYTTGSEDEEDLNLLHRERVLEGTAIYPVIH